MAYDYLQGQSRDLEKASWIETSDGQVARRVQGELEITGGSILAGVVHDYITVSYPDTVTEVFRYYLGGSGGTLQTTITVVYTNATKDFVSTIEKVDP